MRVHLHPQDAVRGGEAVRSIWEDTPSANPLHLVEPARRAVFVLASWGEDPTHLGRRVLRAERDPHLATFQVIESVELETGLRSHARPRTHHLRALLPKPLMRWTFILRATDAFPSVGQNRGDWSPRAIARVLRIHRASAMRYGEEARAILERAAARKRDGA